MLFWSRSQDKLVTLREYADAMPEGQEKIYFAAGESRDRLNRLPQMDLLQDKGYDVLLFTEDVDEFIPQTLRQYDGHDFQNIASGDLGLSSDDEKKDIEQKTEAAKPTLDFVKETLGEAVKEVRLSAELGGHPVCMKPEEGMSFEMEKYFQRMSPEMPAMKSGRILELNPAHPVFEALQLAVAQDQEKAKKYCQILHAQALLMADLPLEDPTAYTDLICSFLN